MENVVFLVKVVGKSGKIHQVVVVASDENGAAIIALDRIKGAKSIKSFQEVDLTEPQVVLVKY